MQFYLPGINNLFFKMLQALPTGVFNKENNQASAAPIEQTLVGFVDKPAGTRIDIYVNKGLQARTTVIDSRGFFSARFALPYTANEDSIEVEVKENRTGLTIQAETFSTSHIAFLLEIQAASLTGVYDEASQLEQNVSIAGVDNNLLQGKFGVFTGLAPRSEQTIDEYRAQTACIWQAFQFASMEKGLEDSIKCLLATGVDVVITPTKEIVGNRVFDLPQFKGAGTFGEGTPPLPRVDPDSPHYYVADIPAAYRTEYPVGGTPLDILGPFSGNWTLDNVQQYTVKTVEGHGNEVQVTVGQNESDAAAQVEDEIVEKRSVADDQLANINILPIVIVKTMTIGGIPATSLPVEDTDFTVDRPTGIVSWGIRQDPVLDKDVTDPSTLTPSIEDRYIVAVGAIGVWAGQDEKIAEWNGSSWDFTTPEKYYSTFVQDENQFYIYDDDFPTGAWTVHKVPDDGTTYTVDYLYRLDESIRTVVRQVKPAHRSIVIIFQNVTSGLPIAIEV